MPPETEAMAGVFGLIPHRARDMTISRRTYNARSETVASKSSYRDAWQLGRLASSLQRLSTSLTGAAGKAVPTRILVLTAIRWDWPASGPAGGRPMVRSCAVTVC